MELRTLKPRIAVLTAVSLLSVSMLGSLVLMSAAIQNSTRFGAMFSVLLITNGVGLLAFVVLIVINTRRLLAQLARREPGARLTLRMLVMFVALSILPVSVLYAFSLDFLQRGIDSWFDVRIDTALNDALELSRNALDLRMRELLRQTEKLAEEMGHGTSAGAVLDLSALRNPGSTVVANVWDPGPNDLDLLRQRSGAEELTLVTPQGRLVESSSSATDIVPNLPSQPLLLQLRQGRSYIGLEPLGNQGLYIRVAVNVPDSNVNGGRRILHALYPVAARMGRLAESVEAAYAKYNELEYLRRKLKLSFAMTLTLVLLSGIATAVWAAFYSARRLAAPISDLAAGTEAVAHGDYETNLPVTSSDELGFLVSSFNDMTRRIARARAEVETQNRYVNTLLSQLSSGVIALDNRHELTTLNESGRQILGLGDSDGPGVMLAELGQRHEHLRPFVDGVMPQLVAGTQRWQQEIQIFSRTGRRVLMCRGTALSFPGIGDRGHVLVFDDITALIKGQRDAAWSEVARRLAHEIKNPLTPIQLSAERLRQKYLAKMPAQDAETLDRLTSTIVQQVDTMKAMVNTFAEYARTPVMNQERIDINHIVEGVIDLFRGANPEAEFELRLDRSLPPVSADAARLRQVVNNLVTNALEATPPDARAHIVVSTSKLSADASSHVELRIEDRGTGIRPEMAGTVFEPYVTNKTKGTGLGLAIVKKIVEEHGGVVTLENNDGPGAHAVIRLPLEDLAVPSPSLLEGTAS